MTTLKSFTVLTIVLFASCKSSPDKTDEAVSQLSNTNVAAETILHNLSDTSTGSFVATLKSGIEETNATINNRGIFKATKGQLFVYESYSHNAWIADGRSAFIPPEKVLRIDTPYFKFNFSKWDFVKNKDYELTQAAQRVGIDLNSIIKRVRNKDDKALKALFNLRNDVDGAAAEEFIYYFWALINLYTDNELLNFVYGLTPADRNGFSELLFENAPLSNVSKYYQLYYPKTLKAISASPL